MNPDRSTRAARASSVRARARIRSVTFCSAVLLLAASCGAPEPAERPELAAPVAVTTWGTMRAVLREGRVEARVALAGLTGPQSLAVGALEGLAGEITVVDGRVLVATPVPADAPGEAPVRCELREARADDRATLLVLADVPAWEAHELGTCASYAELEDAIAAALRARGHDRAAPVPVRVRGRAPRLELHVLAGSCPIANPAGPPPWRSRGACDVVELVGFFAEGAAGRLTHHGRRSHLHAVAGSAMGHLDEVALERAALWLPARAGSSASGPAAGDGMPGGPGRVDASW